MNLQDILKSRPSSRMQVELSPVALERWNPAINAAAQADNTISILDVIGEDFWGEGVTAKRISAALRSIGADKDVVVNINSPGGDLFEGLAIYSMLKEHKGKVTVKVLSLAASAASIIAMAGDEIQIARSGFFMIHNAWTLAAGNRHDLKAVADFLEPLDDAMADIYHIESGLPKSDLAGMMDSETWMGGTQAVEKGFADSYLSDGDTVEAKAQGETAAIRKIDIALAKAGMPRSKRRELMNELKSSTQDAAGNGTPGAADNDKHNAVDFEPDGSLAGVSNSLRGIFS